MAVSNFVITIGELSCCSILLSTSVHRICQVLLPEALECYSTVGVAAVAYLMKADVRTGAATFRRNLKHIRGWLEEQSAAASQYVDLTLSCIQNTFCFYQGCRICL
jgi:hypothetical protein